VTECPEIKDLARFVETGEVEPGLEAHIEACEACKAAVENLEDEVMSLQISISELWFREEISCLDEAKLRTYVTGGLDREARRYVEFHLQDLDCPRCQAVVGAVENEASEEGRRRTTRSKARLDDASVKLLGDLRTKK
jgi:anti-sigma factor RsiW